MENIGKNLESLNRTSRRSEIAKNSLRVDLLSEGCLSSKKLGIAPLYSANADKF